MVPCGWDLITHRQGSNMHFSWTPVFAHPVVPTSLACVFADLNSCISHIRVKDPSGLPLYGSGIFPWCVQDIRASMLHSSQWSWNLWCLWVTASHILISTISQETCSNLLHKLSPLFSLICFSLQVHSGGAFFSCRLNDLCLQRGRLTFWQSLSFFLFSSIDDLDYLLGCVCDHKEDSCPAWCLVVFNPSSGSSG